MENLAKLIILLCITTSCSSSRYSNFNEFDYEDLNPRCERVQQVITWGLTEYETEELLDAQSYFSGANYSVMAVEQPKDPYELYDLYHCRDGEFYR